MHLGIRPVSVLMRSLLSRGPLLGVVLLAVVGIGYAAPPPHSAPLPRALIAQSTASTAITQIFDPASELLPREVARPTPTPSSPTPDDNAPPAPHAAWAQAGPPRAE